jgi:hypothetical protein
MSHHYPLVVILFLTTLVCSTETTALAAQSDTRDYLIIRKIEGGKIIYEKYDFSGQQELDVSDLTVWDKADHETLFNTFYYTSQDLRILLLQTGNARLNDASKASPTEVGAQERAQSNGVGMWKRTSSPTPTSNSSPGNESSRWVEWSKYWPLVWQAFVILASVGIVGALGRWLYKRFYIQRRVKLLLIGEPSTGKTSLQLTLIDPHISKNELLNLETSKAVLKKKGHKHIPRGKFEILPKITDVPGSAFGSVWDEVLESRSHALVILICPYRLNGLGKDGSRELLNVVDDVDQRYVDLQLGYVQAYVEGLLGAKRTKKPKMVILFISKFDLFSKTPPDDSASDQITRQLRSVFSRHIDSAKSAARKANVPYELLIGSAVEKWNTDAVLAAVAKALYKL